MQLPDDEHTGWDRLIQAVLEDDEATDDTTPDTSTTPDLVAMLDLSSMQARAGAIVGDDDRGATI